MFTNNNDSLSVIRQGYEAHARGDFPGVFATLHPDIEIYQTDLVPWGGTYQGHAQARAFFGKLSQHIESYVEPQEYVAAGNQVAVFGRVHGRVRASGQEFDLKVVHLWTVKDGLALRFEAYIDTPGMLGALGKCRGNRMLVTRVSRWLQPLAQAYPLLHDKS